jgi:hypothetical protein
MVPDSAARLQFLTIVTFGRSGSTALQAALNAHPDTIIRGENYAALRGIQAYVESIAAASDRHHAGKPQHPWFGTARLDPAAVLADQRRHVIEYLLRPKPSTRWSGFKEVRYEVGHFPEADTLAHHLLFLNTLFPGMRYLVNVRDPQRASTSGWWSAHPDAHSALRTTVENLQVVTATLRDVLGPGRVALIDHDRWVDDPDIVSDALAEVGFPVEADIVRAVLSQPLTHGKGSQR